MPLQSHYDTHNQIPGIQYSWNNVFDSKKNQSQIDELLCSSLIHQLEYFSLSAVGIYPSTEGCIQRALSPIWLDAHLQGLPSCQTPAVQNKDRNFHEAPAKQGGEGWLFSEQQQRLCHFKPSMTTVHAQWDEVRTFH